MKKEKADVLITTYKRAETDADELINYLDKIYSVDEISEINVPQIVFELQNKTSSKTQQYLSYASLTGGGVATAIGTTLACGAMTGSSAICGGSVTTMALAATYGSYAGLGVAIPILGGILFPVVSFATIFSLINIARVKKYRKENKEKFSKKKGKIKNFREKIQGFIDEIQNRLQEADEIVKRELEQKIKEYKEKAKKLAKEVAIQIDDLMNVDVNKRIQKYDEIILKQYRLQRELEDKLDFLYKEFDKILKEKEELEKKLGILMQLLNTMGCPESVINQALSE